MTDVLKTDVKKRGNKMEEEKQNQVLGDILEEPDELLGYAILGVDLIPIDGEEKYKPYDEIEPKLLGNTHACWGFFPVVN